MYNILSVRQDALTNEDLDHIFVYVFTHKLCTFLQLCAINFGSKYNELINI